MVKYYYSIYGKAILVPKHYITKAQRYHNKKECFKDKYKYTLQNLQNILWKKKNHKGGVLSHLPCGFLKKVSDKNDLRHNFDYSRQNYPGGYRFI